jgi:hypothetical protein
MLKTIGNEIRLTRGDTANLFTSITYDDNTEYKPQDGDKICFTLKKQSWGKQSYIKRFADKNGIIHLDQDDTKYLPYGDYVYDVELRRANGDVITVIPMSKFSLEQEVSTTNDLGY